MTKSTPTVASPWPATPCRRPEQFHPATAGQLTAPWDEARAVPIRVLADPSHRILFVDDDADIRELTAAVLARSGFAADAAADGIAAWEALHAAHYHLLITDESMPRLSGLELVKRLRCARMALPVILASGTVPLRALQWNQELQLAAVLPKPFSPDQLVDTVKEVLRV